ncbi:MAG: hypothetical protein FJ267_08805 [Planctomycetes bacterium]|nr:hypothetical protein [Planctomycetota bacterium]
MDSFQIYDSLTLIALIAELSEMFFVHLTATIHGIQHQIIGVSKTLHGVKDAVTLTNFIADCLIASLCSGVFAKAY